MIPDRDHLRGSLTGDDGGRTYRLVGATHLALGGAINLGTGAVLIYLGATDGLTRLAFGTLDAYVTSQTLVREALTVATLATTGALLVGVALGVLGSVAALAAYGAWSGRRTGWWIPAALCTAINPLAAPPGLIAAVLMWLALPGGPRNSSDGVSAAGGREGR